MLTKVMKQGNCSQKNFITITGQGKYPESFIKNVDVYVTSF